MLYQLSYAHHRWPETADAARIEPPNLLKNQRDVNGGSCRRRLLLKILREYTQEPPKASPAP